MLRPGSLTRELNRMKGDKTVEQLEDVDLESMLEADNISDDYEDSGTDYYDYEEDQFLPALGALLPIAAKAPRLSAA